MLASLFACLLAGLLMCLCALSLYISVCLCLSVSLPLSLFLSMSLFCLSVSVCLVCSVCLSLRLSGSVSVSLLLPLSVSACFCSLSDCPWFFVVLRVFRVFVLFGLLGTVGLFGMSGVVGFAGLLSLCSVHVFFCVCMFVRVSLCVSCTLSNGSSRHVSGNVHCKAVRTSRIAKSKNTPSHFERARCKKPSHFRATHKTLPGSGCRFRGLASVSLQAVRSSWAVTIPSWSRSSLRLFWQGTGCVRVSARSSY